MNFSKYAPVHWSSESDWQERRKKDAEIVAQFKADLFEDLGITGHPKANELFRVVWGLGHAEGYHEVYYYASELVELIK